LDNVLEVIKTSKTINSAKDDLQEKFNLSSEQAEGLLGMTLRRFTSFEKEKLIKEKEELEGR
jgi:DNA gyrase subunit A